MAKRNEVAVLPVQIQSPPMRLKIEDIAYLKSLAESNGTPVCSPKGSQAHKLAVMGLIVDKEMPPCSKKAAMARRELRKIINKELKSASRKVDNLTKVLKSGDFGELIDYQYRSLQLALKPSKRAVVTPAGLTLLAKGSVMVKMGKGCM